MSQTTILIADDDSLIHMSMKALMQGQGWKTLHAEKPSDAEKMIQEESIDLIILDMHFGKPKAGLEVLKFCRQHSTETPVLILSGESGFSTVKEALKLGAEDYLIKGEDEEKFLHTVQQTLKQKKLASLKNKAEREIQYRDLQNPLVGESASIVELRRTTEKIKKTRFNVLITGETGTGKEVISRMLRGKTLDGDLEPFVTVDSSTILSSMAESLLFGHEKGAFTGADLQKTGLFEGANGGTIYFDEIANMPLEIQAKLLRVLQEKEIRRMGGNKTISLDFRVIAATNKDLGELSKKGLFKDDLYQRLKAVPIMIAPLRERREDIPLLIQHTFQKTTGSHFPVTVEAMTLLKNYSWPGNVRELIHLVQYWVAMSEASTIEPSDLPAYIRHEKSPAHSSGAQDFYSQIEAFEAQILKKAYDQCEGNISQLSEKLGMDRSHLYSKLAQHGVHQKKKR